MSGVSKAISDELFFHAKESLRGLGKYGRISIKLQAIIVAKEFGVSLAAKVFATSRPTIMSWIKKFQQDAENGLEIQSGRGRKMIVNANTKAIAYQFMLSNPNATIEELRQLIQQEQHVKISPSSVNNLVKQLGLSYITPRPRHYKADLEKQEDFKKNSKKK